MGRPFKEELEQLQDTLCFISEVDIQEIRPYFSNMLNNNLITIGSGGSLSAAHLAALLHQQSGNFSIGLTPMAFSQSDISLNNANILLISASGKNKDILSAFRNGVMSEPLNLISLCARSISPLKSLSEKYSFTRYLGLDLPCGKDGFLATNSLLMFFILLLRIYNNSNYPLNIAPKIDYQYFEKEFYCKISPILDRPTLIILYGKWTYPIAADIESKFTEAALGHVQISDFRNFAHGRHHWLAKRSSETGILALVTPEEEDIASRTIELLPKEVPLVKLISQQSGPQSTINFLLQVFYLTYFKGALLGIDPGKPGVPVFGSRLYNMPVPSMKNNKYQQITQIYAAITRKTKIRHIKNLSEEKIEFWENACKKYITELEATTFGAVVVDYDGTLCDSNNRLTGITNEVADELNSLISKGIILGIATGRGKSVSKDLKEKLIPEYWNNVVVGYYNGSLIGSLQDDIIINDMEINPDILAFKQKILQSSLLSNSVSYDVRPEQIAIIPLDLSQRNLIRETLHHLVSIHTQLNLRLLESGHSFDILSLKASKINVVNKCRVICRAKNLTSNVLCIGDRGEWSGNDIQLLSTPFSLSVDTVTGNPDFCWNLNMPGIRGSKAIVNIIKKSLIINSREQVFKYRLKK